MKRRQLTAVAGAFALGALPSAELVARAHGVRIKEVGDGKAGAANVRHVIGLGAGLTVAGLDIAKGFAPATVARRGGAGPNVIGALAVAPIAGHIVFTKGRGASTALGGAFALDLRATALAGSGIVAGTIAGRHAEAVIVGAFAITPIMVALRRGPVRAAWGLAIWLLIVAARLRGPAGTPWPPPKNVLWSRFWVDRDS